MPYDFDAAQNKKAIEQGAVTGGAKGALAGAGMGASIGSAVPGIGTAIGAGVGALLGLAFGSTAGGIQGAKSNKDAQKAEWMNLEQKRKADIDASAARRATAGAAQLAPSTSSQLAAYMPGGSTAQYGAWHKSAYGT